MPFNRVSRLPQWLSSKESACSADSSPRLGRSPGGRNGNPLQYFLVGKSHRQGSLASTLQRVTKSWSRLSLCALVCTHTHTHTHTHRGSENAESRAFWLSTHTHTHTQGIPTRHTHIHTQTHTQSPVTARALPVLYILNFVQEHALGLPWWFRW